MKLTNLDTYDFIMEHMDDCFLDALCEAHANERISISVLKYLKERKKILKSCNGKNKITSIADENGVSKGKVYRAIESSRRRIK